MAMRRCYGILVHAFLLLISLRYHLVCGRGEDASLRSDPSAPLPSMLVICTADGQLSSVDAWTGDFRSSTSTPPLIVRSSSEQGGILPGLDGRLYWHDAKEDGLSALPLTIRSLLEHPVKSCDEEETECGILTAAVETSLTAIDQQGRFDWQTSPLMLQRKDYHVEQVSSATGQVVWNVSLGVWQALDFTLPEELQEDFYLPGKTDRRETLAETLHRPSVLPAIVFSGGRTLSAVDPATQQVLWTLSTDSVLASVFGIWNGQWRALQVLSEDDLEATPIPQSAPQLQLTSSLTDDGELDRLVHQLLWSPPPQQAGWTLESASPRLALPASSGDEQDEEVCLTSECPNFEHITLGLPAPAPSLPTRGLLLSWTVVASLVLLLAGLALAGRWWYVSKKRSWLATTQTNWMSPTAKPLRRSRSLGALLSSTDATARPRATSLHSNDHVNVASATVSPPSTMSGIPLVQYSRYASEFEELQALGKGGFGSVFSCRNVLDGRVYAVKKVSIVGSPDDAHFAQRLERVLREVKILAVLDHRHIVRYYTAWLELATGDEQDDDDDTSKGYSSSLVTESASHWPDRSWQRHAWEASLPRRQSFDSGIVFEESTKRDIVWEASGSEKKSEWSASRLARDDEMSTSRRPRSLHTKDAPLFGKEPCTSLAETTKRPMSEPVVASNVRHTLYIQMQLCTQKTVGDFLANAEARAGAASSGIDIPLALQLFLQIAQAVQHVHEQGLIHRDLKPQNCFLDDTSTVKVGDFGLSRESSVDRQPQSNASLRSDELDSNHTTGVGTRSYASPEQMSGSSYDSSTDVYSLGIMLFELLYPMYTGMERNICLSRLRQGEFPSDWDALVGHHFPTLGELIRAMTNEQPQARPTAAVVVDQIQALVNEFTISSLDESRHHPDVILLRIEAAYGADALGQALSAIESASVGAKVKEYGLRSSTVGDKLVAIMEFAIDCDDDQALVEELRHCPTIDKVRRVQSRSTSVGS